MMDNNFCSVTLYYLLYNNITVFTYIISNIQTISLLNYFFICCFIPNLHNYFWYYRHSNIDPITLRFLHIQWITLLCCYDNILTISILLLYDTRVLFYGTYQGLCITAGRRPVSQGVLVITVRLQAWKNNNNKNTINTIALQSSLLRELRR